VWHASVAYHGRNPTLLTPEHRLRAEKALRGVGVTDPDGNWTEYGKLAVHRRRRLTLAEQQQFRVVVCDVRGTGKVDELLAPVRHLLPPGYTE